MRPNTQHYVLGVDNAIVLGRHFYSTSAIFDSCLGIIHSSILGMLITNQEHEWTRTFLRRLMAMWLDHFKEKSDFSERLNVDQYQLANASILASPLKLAHLPDVATPTGFLDVVMVGTVLELSRALSRIYYGRAVDFLLIEEENVARWRYRQLITWFVQTYWITVGGTIVSPWYVVQRFLIEFASSLCAYKTIWDRSDTHQGLSADQLLETIKRHLESDWPTLLPRFRQLLVSPTNQFRWTGPQLEIFRRDQLRPGTLLPEVMDIQTYPVHTALSDGMAGVVAEVDDGDSDGDGFSGDDDGEDSSSAQTEKSSSTDELAGEVMDFGSDSEDHPGATGDALPSSGMY
jgi:hypothetical protein